MRRLIAAAAAIALAIPLGACSLLPQPDSTSKPTGETVAADLQPFYSQTLVWKSCDTGYQCTTAKAPLDWANPGAGSISLALIRSPATGKKLGSLFLNPGGPGGSGFDFVAQSKNGGVSDTLQKSFDVIGFDPRGIGRSTAVSCSTNPKDLDKYFFGDPATDTLTRGSDAWLQEGVDQLTEFGKGCLDHTGPLLGHIDTESVARDLDMMRADVGDTTLTYLGFSYGTYLGATYADLFPTKAGRLVLDGAVDPAESGVQATIGQAVGFESALRAYLKSCLAQSGCPFRGTVDAAMLTIRDLLAALDASPLRNADGRELDGSNMTTAMIFPLYDNTRWSYLNQLFSDVMTGKPAFAFTLADAYFDRNKDGTYASNFTEALISVNCLDDSADFTFDEARANAAKVIAAAPLFGPYFSYSTGCSGWPVTGTRQAGPIHAVGSPDILVLGTTNDPATPYTQAVALAGELDKGHLVTFNGEGHTAYTRSNSCIQNTVDSYYVNGTVPTTDPQC